MPDPDCPICHQYTTIDGTGNHIRPPYAQNEAHIGPFHPHRMCRVQPVPAADTDAITQNIRAFMQFDPSIHPDGGEALDVFAKQAGYERTTNADGSHTLRRRETS